MKRLSRAIVCTAIVVFALILVFGCDRSVSDREPVEPESQVASADTQEVEAGSTTIDSIHEPRFAIIRLPYGVSVEIPADWRILASDLCAAIEEISDAVLDLSGLELPEDTKVNLLRANSTPSTTYASIAVNVRSASLSPSDLMAASDEEIAALGPMMHDVMKCAYEGQMEILRFDGVRREIVSGHPALVIEYVRKGLEGPVVVQNTHLFVGPKEISLVLAYREAEASWWQPIVAYIRQSLIVNGQ